MCIQDLIISRATTWRPVVSPGVRVLGGLNYDTISASPIRYGLIAWTTATGTPSQVGLAGPGDKFVGLPVATGTAGGGRWLTILQFPGIFNTDMYVSIDVNPQTVYEVVMDPELAQVVQRGYADLQRFFGDGHDR